MLTEAVYRGSHPTEGALPEFRADPLGFFLRCAREYGGFVRFRLGDREHVLLSDPEAIHEVLISKHRHFVKSYIMRANRLALGNGLLLSEGALWRRQRRLMQPSFHREQVDTYAETMAVYARELCTTWCDGDVRDVHEEMTALTVRVAVRTLLGVDAAGAGAEVAVAMRALQEIGNQRATSTPGDGEAAGGSERLRRDVVRLYRLVAEIITKRRASGGNGDLLSALLDARDDQGGMSDRQLGDEVRTLVMAGHETTALTLAWCFQLLAEHRVVAERVVAEVDAGLEGRSPTMRDLAELPYVEAVLLETMRLYPPIYIIGRDAEVPCEIAGHELAVGTAVLMSQWVSHRDPRFFDDPDAFRPDRWLDGLAKRLPRFAYFPFGGGQRICLGGSFAMLEAAVILAELIKRFRFELVSTDTPRPLPHFTLRPSGGIRLRLHQRSRDA